ncbi:MAG: tetratricopeptide repeat protein, partial [Thermoproteota archaeon]
YADAIKAYDQAIKLDPKYREAWNNKGVALFNLGKYEVAIRVYDQAIKLDPNDADVWHNKGIALEKLGKYNEAEKCFAKFKELERIRI